MTHTEVNESVIASLQMLADMEMDREIRAGLIRALAVLKAAYALDDAVCNRRRTVAVAPTTSVYPDELAAADAAVSYTLNGLREAVIGNADVDPYP